MDLAFEKKCTGGADMWGNMLATQHLLEKKYEKVLNIDFSVNQDQQIMALRDEVMEYAKATKCFKYWSLADPDPYEVRIEEFSDGIHFYLQQVLNLHLDTHDILEAMTEGDRLAKDYKFKADWGKKRIINKLLSKAMDHLRTPSQADDIKKQHEDVMISLTFFLAAGRVDGFSDYDIERAYYIKNRKNLERLKSGY